MRNLVCSSITYVHTYIHTYVHTCMHTYIHTKHVCVNNCKHGEQGIFYIMRTGTEPEHTKELNTNFFHVIFHRI
jgi:hypothetical protein